MCFSMFFNMFFNVRRRIGTLLSSNLTSLSLTAGAAGSNLVMGVRSRPVMAGLAQLQWLGART